MLYSIQIYCDFSGYADIAIGTAKLFNLRLSKNFDYPYFSTSVRMFWRRWHITLASWMRDYVYIPLGGSRVGAVAQSVQRAGDVPAGRPLARRQLDVRRLGPAARLVPGGREPPARSEAAERADAAARSWLAVVSAVVVFALVTFAWVFFRAPSAGGRCRLLRARARRTLGRRRPRALRAGPRSLGRVARLRVVHAALGARSLGRTAAPARLAGPPIWRSAWRCCCSAISAAVRGSMSSSRRGPVIFLLRVVVFLLVFAALAEVWLRTVTPASEVPLSYQDARSMIFRFDPSGPREGLYTVGRLARRGGNWRVNNAGWISAVDYVPATKRDRPLVALFGDSYIEGFLTDVDQHVDTYLQEVLKPVSDVYAFGLSGWYLEQYVAASRYAASLYQPDLLVIFIDGGDVSDSVRENGVVSPDLWQITANGGRFAEVPPTEIYTPEPQGTAGQAVGNRQLPSLQREARASRNAERGDP